MTTAAPEAVVERTGRYGYSVHVGHGILRWGPGGGYWIVWGPWARQRADRKARRVLAKYLRYEADRWTVTQADIEEREQTRRQ